MSFQLQSNKRLLSLLSILLIGAFGISDLFSQNNTRGAINGLFSVSEGQQVQFSQGNLQYQASTNTWRFAENQYDYVGSANSNVSETYDGWIDLFGWGTSGYHDSSDPYNVNYQPWSTSTATVNTDYNYYGYGPSTNMESPNLTGSSANYDWGVYNAISNGGNQVGLWRTPTLAEWDYLFNTRSTNSGIRYAKGKVNGVNGVILLPDSWNAIHYTLNNTNSPRASYGSNTITADDWASLEQRGCVFLPASGKRRDGTSVYSVGSYGIYWSASYINSFRSLFMAFDADLYTSSTFSSVRYEGLSVRLVRASQVYSFVIGATPSPAEGGAVSGAGAYEEGAECTLTATASAGYNFVNWTENGEVVSTDVEYTFTVTGNRSLVANFAAIPNHWTPEDNDFEDNMTLTCVVLIDGVEQQSVLLELGAFSGDQCRGSQRATYFEPTQRYIYQMMVFGETGEQISFQLYDHELQQELELTSPAPVAMAANGYGTLSDPYVLNFKSSVDHTQALANGWNWWSTFVELSGIDGLEQLENSLGFSGLLIKSRNNGYVEVYDNNGSPYWYGTLMSICNEQMYKVRVSNDCEATLTGLPAIPENHPVTINSGWNWIGFPCDQSVSVATAMGGFSPEHNDVVKGRNGFATYYNENGYEMWYGTLNTLEPGKGYMYRSFGTSPKTLTYQLGRGETVVENSTGENNVFKADGGDFADNMTVIAVVELENSELRSDGYELAAFVNNECRGSVKLMYVEPIDRYVAFLTVLGESSEMLRFQLTDGMETSLSLDEMAFVNDGMAGSLTEPVTLRFGTLGVTDQDMTRVSVSPNPSEGVFRITAEGLQKVEVFNAVGQMVLSEKALGPDMELDLKSQANGLYLLRVVTESGVYSQQIVKK